MTKLQTVKKIVELDRDSAREIALALHANLFDRQSSYSAKDNAQRNLEGRTHYVDGNTLAAFHSRIISSRDTDCGTLFSLVESVAADYRNTSRGFRFVVFDLVGTVINDRASANKETLYRTSAQAEKAMWSWLDAFDTLAHYRAMMIERAERMQRDAAFMLKTARAIKVGAAQ